MTVDLLIKYTNPGRRSELIPIATQRDFNNHWLPLSTENGLKWIPLFGTLRIEHDDIPDIVGELTLLERYFRNQTDLSPDSVNHFVSRIERLKSVLQNAHQKWGDIDYLSL